MKIKSIREIEPVASRCIEVDSPDRLFALQSSTGKKVATHNSVAQRNIILSCILRPESWRLVGIDLKKVELSSWRAYSNVVLGVATTIEDALTVLRFAQTTMMKRYSELEQLGLNNFLDLPEKGQALLVMVDEMGELLSPTGVKALSGNTPIPTPTGVVNLDQISVGDQVLDIHGKPTTVVQKYIPTEQNTFQLTIISHESGQSESLVAGSEHNWVAYFEDPQGLVTGPEILDTRALHQFKKEQENLPLLERTSVKFKRFAF